MFYSDLWSVQNSESIMLIIQTLSIVTLSRDSIKECVTETRNSKTVMLTVSSRPGYHSPDCRTRKGGFSLPHHVQTQLIQPPIYCVPGSHPPGESGRNMKLIAHLYLMARIRIYVLCHTYSRYGAWALYALNNTKLSALFTLGRPAFPPILCVFSERKASGNISQGLSQ
jgi:hypothetical protein